MPGAIESYVHTGNQIGVLVEVNCQNNLTATTSEFKTLAKEIALQIAACPNVRYVKISDIPLSVIKQVSEQIKQEDKKQEILQECLQEMCLYDQIYIRDESLTVEDLIKLRIAQLSENITIGRFARFVKNESNNYDPPSDPDSGVPSNPFPNSPNPLTEEAELD